MKGIIKFIGCLLLAFAFSIVTEQREHKQTETEIKKHNVWVKAGIQDHQNFKNNIVMMVENGTK